METREFDFSFHLINDYGLLPTKKIASNSLLTAFISRDQFSGSSSGKYSLFDKWET